LDRTNKKSFIVVGFSPERFLVISEKFDSDVELDAGIHKTNAFPPITHGYGWAWAWAWVWAPNVGLCIAYYNEDALQQLERK
jgi:hypothetical protein